MLYFAGGLPEQRNRWRRFWYFSCLSQLFCTNKPLLHLTRTYFFPLRCWLQISVLRESVCNKISLCATSLEMPSEPRKTYHILPRLGTSGTDLNITSAISLLQKFYFVFVLSLYILMLAFIISRSITHHQRNPCCGEAQENILLFECSGARGIFFIILVFVSVH